MNPSPRFEIPADAWESLYCDCGTPDDAPPCRFAATVYVCGARFYVEAVAVRYTDDEQLACTVGQDRLDALAREFDAGAMQTVQINGHPYVLVFCPGDL